MRRLVTGIHKEIEAARMDNTSRALLLEVRSILYILHNIAKGGVNSNEDLLRQEMVYLLSLAKSRLDALSSIDHGQY